MDIVGLGVSLGSKEKEIFKQFKNTIKRLGMGGGGGRKKIIFRCWFREWEVSGSWAGATAPSRF